MGSVLGRRCHSSPLSITAEHDLGDKGCRWHGALKRGKAKLSRGDDALLAPIESLPYELLQCVLMHLSERDRFALASASCTMMFSMQQDVLTSARIQRYSWRAVVHSLMRPPNQAAAVIGGCSCSASMRNIRPSSVFSLYLMGGDTVYQGGKWCMDHRALNSGSTTQIWRYDGSQWHNAEVEKKDMRCSCRSSPSLAMDGSLALGENIYMDPVSKVVAGSHDKTFQHVHPLAYRAPIQDAGAYMRHGSRGGRVGYVVCGVLMFAWYQEPRTYSLGDSYMDTPQERRDRNEVEFCMLDMSNRESQWKQCAPIPEYAMAIRMHCDEVRGVLYATGTVVSGKMRSCPSTYTNYSFEHNDVRFYAYDIELDRWRTREPFTLSSELSVKPGVHCWMHGSTLLVHESDGIRAVRVCAPNCSGRGYDVAQYCLFDDRIFAVWSSNRMMFECDLRSGKWKSMSVPYNGNPSGMLLTVGFSPAFLEKNRPCRSDDIGSC